MWKYTASLSCKFSYLDASVIKVRLNSRDSFKIVFPIRHGRLDSFRHVPSRWRRGYLWSHVRELPFSCLTFIKNWIFCCMVSEKESHLYTYTRGFCTNFEINWQGHCPTVLRHMLLVLFYSNFNLFFFFSLFSMVETMNRSLLPAVQTKTARSISPDVLNLILNSLGSDTTKNYKI